MTLSVVERDYHETGIYELSSSRFASDSILSYLLNQILISGTLFFSTLEICFTSVFSLVF